MADDLNIDWQSSDSHLLLNSRLPQKQIDDFSEQVAAVGLKAHCFVATSGSRGASKLVALSKEAVQVSAAAVNDHLQISTKDVWGLALPIFHLGGLSILARASLSRSRVADLRCQRWQAEGFCEQLNAESVTLTSLVPTQLHDLVHLGLTAPKKLRCLLLGSAALRVSLYSEARALGWPVLPTYGLTECASQVATASMASLEGDGGTLPGLEILPHIQLKTSEGGRIVIQSAALCSGYVENGVLHSVCDEHGWYLTGDCGELRDGTLNVFGRVDDQVKIGGELVSLPRLQNILEQCKSELNVSTAVELFIADDARLGAAVQLAVEGAPTQLNTLQAAFNAQVMPFEQIRRVHRVERMPYSELGKLRLSELKKSIGL